MRRGFAQMVWVSKWRKPALKYQAKTFLRRFTFVFKQLVSHLIFLYINNKQNE